MAMLSHDFIVTSFSCTSSMLISSVITGNSFLPMLAASSSPKAWRTIAAMISLPKFHHVHTSRFAIVEIPAFDRVVLSCW